jgi:hypothetical protein
MGSAKYQVISAKKDLKIGQEAFQGSGKTQFCRYSIPEFEKYGFGLGVRSTSSRLRFQLRRNRQGRRGKNGI